MKFLAHTTMPGVSIIYAQGHDAVDIRFSKHHTIPERTIRLDYFQMCALVDLLRSERYA